MLSLFNTLGGDRLRNDNGLERDLRIPQRCQNTSERPGVSGSAMDDVDCLEYVEYPELRNCMECCGGPWSTMECHGAHWSAMENVEYCGAPGLHGVPWSAWSPVE